MELVPHEKLEGDLPQVLIEGHAHWLNLSKSVLEIRSLDKLWEGSSENWSVSCTHGGYRMRKGRRVLVDIRSPTWTMVSSLMKPLDSPQNLIITISPVDADQPQSPLRLSVNLPRYGLSFYVDEDGDLRSRNIRGMVYDENQSIGTMFGLVNQLVLRPKSRAAQPGGLVPRCVLIPEGDISFRKNGHHVHVEIDIRGPTSQRITHQTYKVDNELGCLTGNVSLTNKLYCAYLHALTSGCGTDPLTGRSGTEEALFLLRSAGYWSIMKLSSREAELLSLIAAIRPTRKWYPEHLKCMQKVEWLDLPATTQHHELYIVANGIREHCERVLSFQNNQSNALFQSFPQQDEHLLKRSALRAAYLFPSEFSGQPSGTGLDVRYPGRDVLDGTASAEHRAYTAAIAVYRRIAHGARAKCLENLMEEWRQQEVSRAPLSLQYDNSWVKPDLPSIWFEAYDLLRRNDEGKWIQLLFSLPAMAYGSPELSELVPVFVAFATDLRFCLEDPPPYDFYDLSKGYTPSSDTLRKYVVDCAYSFDYSPESIAPAKPRESSASLRYRQLKMFTDRRDSDADATVRQLLDAWPCETPPGCSLDPALYHLPDFTSNAHDHFASCYRNVKLRDHLIRVQNIMKNGVHSQVVPTSNPPYSCEPSQSVTSRVSWSLTMDQLFIRPAPLLRSCRKSRYITDAGQTSCSNSDALHQLINVAASDATDLFQCRYISVLRDSANSLGRELPPASRKATRAKKPTIERLLAYYAQSRQRYTESLDCLKRQLSPHSSSERALELSGQWPRVTTHALFRFLASSSPIVLPDEWKNCLIRLALLLLELQRTRRLLRLHLDGLPEEFCKESENGGCDGWSADEHPDWLLIQVCFPWPLFLRQLRWDTSMLASRQLLDSSRSGGRRQRDDITQLWY